MHSPPAVSGKGTKELRKGRSIGRNQIYHITTVTLDRYPVFSVFPFATRKINGVSDRSGRLWRKGLHDRAIRREEDLEAVATYIMANPLRAGIVRSVREYPHWDAVWM